MKATRILKVPTGEIIIVKGERGYLEVLSIGDYGKDVNLNAGKPVPDGLPLLPLTEKWVVTLSTQYGCSMGCKFCDVPEVGKGVNASFHDMMGQIAICLSRPGKPAYSDRLNVHFARMGEPTFNKDVLNVAVALSQWKRYNVHPVVSTMMPNNCMYLSRFIRDWMHIKNDIYNGNAGLQLSINSTDSNERRVMFNGNALELGEIATVMHGIVPAGRKITLNFAVAGYTVDTDMLADLFSPEHYIVKLTPMHKTRSAYSNGIHTDGDYTAPDPYEELNKRFMRSGFETLVFIASEDEDLGRITCGNAILSGTYPHKYAEDLIQDK
jgi:23S rRNA (adenine2503-C2)-methyltransferase